MIRTLLFSTLALLIAETGWSDTIVNYQHIRQSIPKMEIKADEQSQAWARSARHVLTITNESIAETLVALNEQATKQGKPFFCIPKNQQLNADSLSVLIEEASRNINQQQAGNQMTVSQIALNAVIQKYPCNVKSQDAYSSLSNTHSAMQHAEANS